MLNLTLDKRNLVFVDILLTVPKTFATEENAQSTAMIISATSKMCPNIWCLKRASKPQINETTGYKVISLTSLALKIDRMQL